MMHDIVLKLKAGGFYKARNGAIWCCYRIDSNASAHAVAKCIAIATFTRPWTEYFYIDGRYDSEGKREHTLIAELDAESAMLELTAHEG